VNSVPRVLSLLLLSVFSAAVPPPLRSAPLPSLCPQAIQRLARAIASTGANTPRQRIIPIPAGVRHPFHPHNSALIVILGGGDTPAASARARRSLDLMHSPQLQSRLASKVFQDCEEIVKVSFVLERTDWSASFFRSIGVSAIPARCLDPGPNTGQPAWGEEICL
jgi:hypothetical protein